MTIFGYRKIRHSPKGGQGGGGKRSMKFSREKKSLNRKPFSKMLTIIPSVTKINESEMIKYICGYRGDTEIKRGSSATA